MAATQTILPSSTDTGQLGVKHLKRYWAKSIAKRNGQLKAESHPAEWSLDKTMLNVLGLGLEQTISFVFQNQPSFEVFEQWILELNGGEIDPTKIAQFNSVVERGLEPIPEDTQEEMVLTEEDLAFWDINGYVIIRNAVTKEDCDAAIKAIEDFMGIDINDPATWYLAHPAKQGIMVQLFQHPALDKNRHAPKIRRAYEQLWQRRDLVVSTDRVGFNPPETELLKFQGTGLHWDVSLQLPIPFGTQGILYLTDTLASQGALTVVPGFQHRVANWLGGLPTGANPRQQNLHALGSKPIAANGGDFIIWHQALPHGASPNTASLPRVVQYINYQPAIIEEHEVWI